MKNVLFAVNPVLFGEDPNVCKNRIPKSDSKHVIRDFTETIQEEDEGPFTKREKEIIRCMNAVQNHRRNITYKRTPGKIFK